MGCNLSNRVNCEAAPRTGSSSSTLSAHHASPAAIYVLDWTHITVLDPPTRFGGAKRFGFHLPSESDLSDQQRSPRGSLFVAESPLMMVDWDAALEAAAAVLSKNIDYFPPMAMTAAVEDDDDMDAVLATLCPTRFLRPRCKRCKTCGKCGRHGGCAHEQSLNIQSSMSSAPHSAAAEYCCLIHHCQLRSAPSGVQWQLYRHDRRLFAARSVPVPAAAFDDEENVELDAAFLRHVVGFAATSIVAPLLYRPSLLL